MKRDFERGPRIGDIVHYVSYGTPGGEYTKECRAAIVTAVTEHPDEDGTAALCVLNPTGQFFNPKVEHAEDVRAAAAHADADDCPQSWSHGNPMRYCACGWTEPTHPGGTWHWPEARDEQH